MRESFPSGKHRRSKPPRQSLRSQYRIGLATLESASHHGAAVGESVVVESIGRAKLSGPVTEGEFHPQPCLQENSVTTRSVPAAKTSPLHELHEAAGASFTDFAGWLMPVRYSSDLVEHHAVRTAAGIFDLSHMAEIAVSGPDAPAFLDYALAGLISAMPPMKAKYSLLLDESGGIVDDVIVYRTGDREYLVVANAGNRAVVVDALTDRSTGYDVSVSDRTDDLALIAVQGPASRSILEATEGLEQGAEQPGIPTLATLPTLERLAYYQCTRMTWAGRTVLVARTGYTGEDGFELYVEARDAGARDLGARDLRARDAASLWRALETAGAPLGLVPAGLASRDTLRLEAGMPLYGHELGLDILPAQAGLGRVVSLAKDFIGKRAVEAGPRAESRVLVGLVSEGRRAGRAGYTVFDSGSNGNRNRNRNGDTEVGSITSGALSPTLGHPIAMAYVNPESSDVGTELQIDVRGTRVAASVVPLPFYKKGRS